MKASVRLLRFEQLEIRLPLAAASPVADADVFPSPHLIEVRLEISTEDEALADGDPLLHAGDRFVVDVYIGETEESLFTKPPGSPFFDLLHAKIDLQFDPAIAQPLPAEISHGDTFNEKTTGRIDSSGGAIRDLGGLDPEYFGRLRPGAAFLGPRESLLASVPFVALSAGDPAIVPRATDDGQSFIGLGFNEPISPSNVAFEFDSLTIAGPLSDTIADAPSLVAQESSPRPAAAVDLAQSFPTRAAPPDLIFGIDASPHDRLMLFSSLRIQPAASAESTLGNQPLRKSRNLPADQLFLENQPGNVTAEARQTQSPARSQTNDADEDEDDENRFWRNYDLELLDEESSESPMEMRFRLLRLRFSLRSPMRSASGPEQPKVPSVIDQGFVDIAPWLLDPKYHSWAGDRSAAERPDPAERVIDEAGTATDETFFDWVPDSAMVRGIRLELIEETELDAVTRHPGWFAQVESKDKQANTNVPEN